MPANITDVGALRLWRPAKLLWLQMDVSWNGTWLSVSASPVGLPYEGMAPSGPLYFLHKATPPAMPPILGAPSVGT
jgi:hypothetical protein